MSNATTERRALTYSDRIDAIRTAKLEQTQEKQRVIGAMDHDDHALILPPAEYRELVESISGSGMPITDVLIKGVEMEPNHENGGFYGPRACGANFRRLLECHPAYVDPTSSLAGGYMVNFASYRKGRWKPEFGLGDLKAVRERYQLFGCIGAGQHFCQDLAIGFELGWQGILEKIAHSRPLNPERGEFYDGLEDVARGIQAWIRTNADTAREMADAEEDLQLRSNLEELTEINERLLAQPPQTFREACQWMLWYDMAARMYNGSGSLGRLDVLLTPFYERERAEGALTDEEAIFHIACLLARDTAYFQLGGPDENGVDVTNHVSFLVLEAIHLLKIPANAGVCVGENVDPDLLRRSVEILLEDRLGIPKFLGVNRTIEGFVQNGYPVELARTRAYAGCHWSSIPGREYTLNDCVKIHFGAVFEVAFRDLMNDPVTDRSVEALWRRFEEHLQAAVDGTAQSIDFHMRHMKDVFPELVLDLLCHGPIEKGVDASDGYGGGVEFYNMCVDGAALATVADSFAAIERRIESEEHLTWDALNQLLEEDWEGMEGERMRMMMRNIERYGSGGSRADAWAKRIADLFTHLVKEKPTPEGFAMVPGIFSWANTLSFGEALGATPNGRHKGAPISHGANPDPGFRTDGAPTAMSAAIASVQSAYGNATPMQLELDPGTADGKDAADHVMQLIRTHFDTGGTQINLNVLDRATVLEAHEDPSLHPDLIVRVTGFSAYFASLSPEFRQIVVDRIVDAN